MLVLTQYYRPEPNFITADVAESLARDADVTVVAAAPNYPTGKIYPGHSFRRLTRVVENGVRVWRVPHVPVGRSISKIRRALSYLSFTGAAAVLAPFVCPRPDVVWVYHTPFTTALAALFFKYLRGSRIVFTSADLWPESFLAAGVANPGRLLDATFAYSRWINRQADTIICSTRGTAERYARDGIPAEALHMVPVWTESASSIDDDEHASVETPRIVYAGNLGPAQALETVIEGAAQLARDGVDARFAFYGSGAAQAALQEMADRLGATNVEFFGPVAHSRAFHVSASATAQIVSLRRTPLFRMTVPSKLVTAFAAGAPILCGLDGESAELASRSGGAVFYDPTDVASFCNAVRTVLGFSEQRVAAMRRQMREYYDAHFRRDRLLETYRRLLLGAAEPARESAALIARRAAP